MLVAWDNPIAAANGVDNAILVEGDVLGEVMFYGPGAGKLPTASAVVADVVACIMPNEDKYCPVIWQETGDLHLTPHRDSLVEVLLRLNDTVTKDQVEMMFSDFGLVFIEPEKEGEIAFITGGSKNLSEQRLAELLSLLEADVLARYRLY